MLDVIINKLMILPGILIGLAVHEYAHALVAYKLGDESQRYLGRLTLDPIKHIDPVGFILLLLVGFGWAKPVMVNSRNFKNPRRDDTLVSLAGPVMNFLVAILFTIILGIVIVFAKSNSQILSIIITMITGVIQINIVLMIFNLIPIPPLDGHHVLGNIVGAKLWNFYYKYADYLRFGLMLLIIFDGIDFIIGPLVNNLYAFLINTMLEITAFM